MTNHAREHKKEVYVCQLCDKSFNTEEVFHSHKEEHSHTMVIDCTMCGEHFNNPEQLAKHKDKHCMT